MPNKFTTRILGKTWNACGGDFELAMKGAIPYLEKSCPDLAETFQFDIYCVSGMGFCSENMTIEEEKYILEALKLAYCDRENEAAQLPEDSDKKEYLLKFLPQYRELIEMLEEEIRDIVRGKLIVQEDGTAILNEDFKVD
jgi:hypothetical protein